MTVGIESTEEPKAAVSGHRDGRDRLLNGARALLAEKGYAGMELRDVAERGKAPRGSIYHHFPGGKRQLAAEAAALEGTQIRDAIEDSLERARPARDARALRRHLPPPGGEAPGADRLPGRRGGAGAARRPGAGGGGDRRLQSWEEPIAAKLEKEGVEPERAAAFAGLVVSTIEGALLRARAAGDTAPLDSAIAGLGEALDALLSASGGGAASSA